MMMTIGGDSHKRTHTFVVVDELGRQVDEKTVRATSDGHLDAIGWAAQWPERRWALEDCRQVTRRLEQDLVRSGESVVRVPTKLMADMRRGAREPGKSDPIDASAVARAALREPDLPVARLDGPEREMRLLVDHREDLVGERTRMQSRLRWHMHELIPEHVVQLRSLDRFHVLDDLERRFVAIGGPVADIAAELTTRIRELTIRINELYREITSIVTSLAPSLLALEGCGALSAAKIVAETAGADRFRSRAAYARWNGTAPIPVWTANPRFRLSRGGKPPGQRRHPPDRYHPMARPRSGPRLHQRPHRAGRHQTVCNPSAQTADLRRGLPTPPHRPRPPPTSTTRGRRMTTN